jgi:hypothetical protein
MNDLIAQFITGEVVESLSGAVSGDQIIGIDLL